MDKGASKCERKAHMETLRGTFLIDAHTHIYGCFDQDIFLNGALENFRAAGAALGCLTDPTGWLLLTEKSDCNFFQQFLERATVSSTGQWGFLKTQEDHSLIAHKRGSRAQELVIVAGRQIETRESLEVLALGTCCNFPDKLSMGATLEKVIQSGAIAVLPWGLGKWWFRRRKLIGDILRSYEPRELYVGDNGGRPGFLLRSKLIDLAASRNVFNLPGSDPLPFATESSKAGSYGFLLRGQVNRRRPAEGLKALIRLQQSQPETYGKPETAARFVTNQVRIHTRRSRGLCGG